MHQPFVLGLQQWIVESSERGSCERRPLVEDDLEGSCQRAFDRRAAQFRIALGCVWIAGGQQCAGNGDRVVHGRAFADAPIINVAPEITGRDGVNDVRFLRGKSDHSEMGSDRNSHVLEDAVVLFDRCVVDRNARIVDGLVHHAEGIGLRRPLKIVNRLRPVALSGRIDLIDGDDFTRLRIGDQLLVMEAPPGGRVAAK